MDGLTIVVALNGLAIVLALVGIAWAIRDRR
jgi:hypothetical protein